MCHVPGKSLGWDRAGHMLPLASIVWRDIEAQRYRVLRRISAGGIYHSPLRPSVFDPTCFSLARGTGPPQGPGHRYIRRRLFFSLTLMAIAFQVQLNPGNTEVVFLLHLCQQLANQWALKLDHPPTAAAPQVLMLCRALDLIGTAHLAQVPFLDQTLFPEQAQVTVDSGKANTGVFLGGPAIKLLGIKVRSSGLQGRKQEPSLRCKWPQICCSSAAIASHSHRQV